MSSTAAAAGEPPKKVPKDPIPSIPDAKEDEITDIDELRKLYGQMRQCAVTYKKFVSAAHAKAKTLQQQLDSVTARANQPSQHAQQLSVLDSKLKVAMQEYADASAERDSLRAILAEREETLARRDSQYKDLKRVMEEQYLAHRNDEAALKAKFVARAEFDKLKQENNDLKERISILSKSLDDQRKNAHAHMVLSSDDEGGGALNSSFSGGNAPLIKHENLTADLADGGESDQVDDLLLLMDQVLTDDAADSASTPAPAPSSSGKKTASAFRTPKAASSAKRAAATAASGKKKASAAEPVMIPCNHLEEIERLREETASLKLDIDSMYSQIQDLNKVVAAERQRASAAQSALDDMRKRMAIAIGLAPPESPSAPPLLSNLSDQSLGFGMDDIESMDVDSEPIAPPAPIPAPAPAKKQSVAAPAKAKAPEAIITKFAATAKQSPSVAPAQPKAAAPPAPSKPAVVAPAPSRKRTMPSESTAPEKEDSTTAAPPAKRAKVTASVAQKPTQPLVAAGAATTTTTVHPPLPPRATASSPAPASGSAPQKVAISNNNLDIRWVDFDTLLSSVSPAANGDTLADLMSSLLMTCVAGPPFLPDSILRTLSRINLLIKERFSQQQQGASVTSALVDLVISALVAHYQAQRDDAVDNFDLHNLFGEMRFALVLQMALNSLHQVNTFDEDSLLDALSLAVLARLSAGANSADLIVPLCLCRFVSVACRRFQQLARARAFLIDATTESSHAIFTGCVCAIHLGWPAVLAQQLNNRVVKTIDYLLSTAKNHLRSHHNSQLYGLLNRTRKTFGWDDDSSANASSASDSVFQEIKIPFEREIDESDISSMSDALAMSRGGLPKQLRGEINLSQACLQLLCSKMSEGQVKTKFFSNWLISTIGSNENESLQSRMLRASGPILLKLAKDTEADAFMTHLTTIVCSNAFSMEQKFGAAESIEFLLACQHGLSQRQSDALRASLKQFYLLNRPLIT